jgi:UDP:flavonoid glycosyltransferase YjiC (YdhE family)
MKRIVLSTFGSLGDLNPFLAIGLALQQRGHSVLIASSGLHRPQIEALGLAFHAIRPDLAPFVGDEEFLRRVWDPQRGTEYLIRDIMLPHLEDSFEDLREACAGADLIITHALWYAAPIVAELLRVPSVAVALQPSSLLSVYDPPVIAAAPFAHRLRPLGPAPFRFLYWLTSLRTRRWAAPIAALRRRNGLPPLTRDAILFWPSSSTATMAWFSPLLGPPQSDWPPNTSITGFPFYDLGDTLTPATEAFVHAGEAPIVFTLGSAAVHVPGEFYQESAEAAQRLNRRAILVAGEAANGPLRALASDSIHVTAYEPYAALFPHAAAVVHQCGIGTTAESLRAGVPTLAVPWGHDQFDNADRLRALGCADILNRNRYSGKRAAASLSMLLASSSVAAACAHSAEILRKEDGVAAACDVLEKMA